MSRPVLDVAVLLPDLLDLHGDRGNGEVLARRAAWEGVDVRLHTDLDEAPDVIIAGDAADSAVDPALDQLRRMRSALAEQVARGVAVLAVGAGWDVLSELVEVVPGTWRAGAGVFAGEAYLLDQRASGELIGRSPWGPIAGYENHARGYRALGLERAWGGVRLGVGNGDGTEGVVSGSLLGTHVHGPVLATHPRIADAILDLAMRRRHSVGFRSTGELAQRVDGMAARAGEAILRRTRLARLLRRTRV